MTNNDDWDAAVRVRRAVAMVDLVESVRLMQAHESEVIARWRRFVAQARQRWLPAHGGVLVKSLGDGLLMSFDDAARAVRCARDLGDEMQRLNVAAAGPPLLELRTGVHVADVVVDDIDIYGNGVNLAARLTALGRPGDIVLSSEARDQLVPGLDAEVEDLGECFVKHLDEPVRAWRIAGAPPPAAALRPEADRIPAVAVLPLHGDGGPDAPPSRVAAVIADELAALVGACSGLAVIARPTIAAVAQRQVERARLYAHLRVLHLVEVQCTLRADHLHARIALHGAAQAADPSPLMEFTAVEPLHASRGRASESLHAAANAIVGSIASAGLASTPERHLPRIGSYALLLSAIGHMHRMSRDGSERSRQALDELLARHPRAPEPQAWSAKWHMLRVAQRWSADPARDATQAEFHVRRALDAEPRHPLALAIQGQMAMYQHGDLAAAEALILQAVESGPSEPLAWLFLSNLRAHQGHGDAAQAAVRRARALSPLDPTRFLFDMFAAQAALCAGDAAQARAHAEASLRGNRMHLPSYPPLVISNVLLGDLTGARAAARQYLELSPAASARRYAERFRGPQEQGERFAAALREAGIPA